MEEIGSSVSARKKERPNEIFIRHSAITLLLAEDTNHHYRLYFRRVHPCHLISAKTIEDPQPADGVAIARLNRRFLTSRKKDGTSESAAMAAA